MCLVLQGRICIPKPFVLTNQVIRVPCHVCLVYDHNTQLQQLECALLGAGCVVAAVICIKDAHVLCPLHSVINAST